VLAIAPVVTGIVCGVLWMVDNFHLSLFQLNALAMLITTGVVEFVSTLWVRNVVLQRGAHGGMEVRMVKKLATGA